MGETIRMRTANVEKAAFRSGLVTVLDIGSSKVICLICRVETGNVRVLGAALRESQGLKGGTITSLDLAEESIREVVAAAENLADTRIQNVLVSVACGSPTSVTARAAMALDGALVSDSHLLGLLAEARARTKLEGHEIIQSAPTSYVVDEARGVRDPSGMFCQSARRHGARGRGQAVAAAEPEARRRALPSVGGRRTILGPMRAGLPRSLRTKCSLAPPSSTWARASPPSRSFSRARWSMPTSFPRAAPIVTADLARILAAPVSAAERLKTLYGAALGDIESGTDVVAVPQMGERER